MDLLPYGSPPGDDDPADGPVPGLSLTGASRTRQLWILFGFYVCAGFFIQIALVSTTIYAVDLGTTGFRAAAPLSVMGLGGTVGRVFGGFASDRLGTRPVLVAATLLMAVQFGLLLLFRHQGVLFLFAAFFGIACGEILCAMPLLSAELFGLRHHGTLLGVITFASTFGGGAGPVTAGYLFDLFRNYDVIWAVCAAVALVASISFHIGGARSRR